MTSSYGESRCPCFWDYLLSMARIWGVLTAAVLSGVGVDLAYHGHSIGACVLIGSALVFLLEVAWALVLFLNVYLRQEEELSSTAEVRGGGDGCGCLRATIRWCDKPSKKGMLYVVLGAVILLWPQHHLWLSPVAGVMLLLLATLYFLLTFKARGESRDTLLSGRVDSFERFDDSSDLLDDSLPEPIAGRPTEAPGPATPQSTRRDIPRSASALLLAHRQADPQVSEGPRAHPGTRAHALVDGFGDQEIVLRL